MKEIDFREEVYRGDLKNFCPVTYLVEMLSAELWKKPKTTFLRIEEKLPTVIKNEMWSNFYCAEYAESLESTSNIIGADITTDAIPVFNRDRESKMLRSIMGIIESLSPLSTVSFLPFNTFAFTDWIKQFRCDNLFMFTNDKMLEYLSSELFFSLRENHSYGLKNVYTFDYYQYGGGKKITIDVLSHYMLKANYSDGIAVCLSLDYIEPRWNKVTTFSQYKKSEVEDIVRIEISNSETVLLYGLEEYKHGTFEVKP